LPNPGKPDVDLFTVSTGPVHPSAAAATAEPLGCFQDVWWDRIGHLFGGHVLEDTVAIAAARPFEILGWRKLMSLEHLGELSLKDARVHHLGLRPNRRELSIPGQQPPTLASCDPGELGIRRLGSEVEAIVATEAKPAGKRTEHRVAEKAGVGRGLSHGDSRIAWNGGLEGVGAWGLEADRASSSLIQRKGAKALRHRKELDTDEHGPTRI